MGGKQTLIALRYQSLMGYAIAWLVVSLLAAIPYTAFVGLIVMALFAAVCSPLISMGVTAPAQPFIIFVLSLVGLVLASVASGSGMHRTARKLALAFVNLLGLLFAVSVTLTVNGWSWDDPPATVPAQTRGPADYRADNYALPSVR